MRRIAKIAALAAASLLLAPAAPAQATQTSVRAAYHDIALYSLDQMLALDTGAGRDDEGWQSAYTAELLAYRDGWSDPDTLNYLTRTIDSKVANGYGKGYQRDAFSDGTLNSEDTVYTVTMTDHVGEPLLAGYDAGVVNVSELQFIADSLWSMPRYKTDSADPAADGRCIAYTNNPNDQPSALNPPGNDRYWCIINVNIGAAAFLQKLQDRGITPAGATVADVDLLIDEIYDFTEWAQGKSNAGPNEWPYSFRSYDATFAPGNNPQDSNHASYTAESLTALHSTPGAVALGNAALDAQTSNGNHFPFPGRLDNFQDDYANLIGGRAFGIVGRQRAASVRPNAVTKQLLTEAEWWTYGGSSLEGHDHAYSWGQMGRWAARLATNATAEAGEYREVGFMSTPRVYDYPYKGSTGWAGAPANLKTVQRGERYHVFADARFYDASGERHFLTGTPLRISKGTGSPSNVSLWDTKTTGYEWYGARFVWDVTEPVGSTVYICAEVTAGQATPHSSNCKSVTVQ